MSSADPRYYQLWASRPTAPRPTSSKRSTTSTQPYRVDLDVPGGLTYAPSDEVAAHGTKRRLFLPRRGAANDEYDFGLDVATGRKRVLAIQQTVVTPSPSTKDAQDAFILGDEDEDGAEATAKSSTSAEDANPTEKSEAQKYVETIDMMPKKPMPQSQEGEARQALDPMPAETTPSIAPSDTRSVRSTMTASALARSRGLLDHQPRLDGSTNVIAFKPPPSVSGNSYRSVDPWNAPSLRGRSEFDRLTEAERDRGLTRAEEYAGEGNAPTRDEVRLNAERDALVNEEDDTATIRTKATTRSPSEGPLRIADIFIPDPRPMRPLRLVRRTDPSQVLVVCAGEVLSASEAVSRQAAVKLSQKGITDYKTEQAQEVLASFGGDEAGDVRAGLGVYFCPQSAGIPAFHGPEASASSSRVEENFSRRMERVTFPYSISPVRAMLRSVLAAVEYIPFPEEGFNKVVVAVHAEWLVSAISTDIHEWKRNEWRLKRSSAALGNVGQTVPDRDLWEALDAVVSKWEEIDVNIRFWVPAKDEALLAEARELARQGACKDNQQPQMVKWVKKRSR